MLQLDDVQLYDLSEAGGLLFKDPARLAREVRLHRVPATRLEHGLALPAPWVDAEAGVSNADAVSLATYWLARLAPPSRMARRPLRPRTKLPASELLEPEEAARRLCATPAALERLDVGGAVPSLRVDDAVRYDAVLVDLVAREGEGEDVGPAVEERRSAVRTWARFEYGTAEQPSAVARPPARKPASAPPPEGEGPAAFEIPKDLGLEEIADLEEEARPPTSGLMEIDGIETVDED